MPDWLIALNFALIFGVIALDLRPRRGNTGLRLIGAAGAFLYLLVALLSFRAQSPDEGERDLRPIDFAPLQYPVDFK